MILAILWLLAAPLPQAADVAALEEQVRTLTDQDLHDAALEAVKKFVAANPSLAEESRVKRLQQKARDLAEEADRLFKTRMAEAQAHLDGGRHPKAVETAGRALQMYPERKAQVAEFQNRARGLMAGKGMVRVPGQPCWIGSDDREGEKPLRKVTLPAFLIDLHPVTNEEYSAYVVATGAAPPLFWTGGKPPKGRDRHPVVLVSWEDAAAYAAWAGKRLPTAEEWEVAARGPDRREFPWGNSFQEKEDQFPCNSLEYWQVNKTLSPGTTPVGQFPIQSERGAFGASMGGNVWEWTSTIRPGKVGDRPAEFRILKGGSFMTASRALRCAGVLPENPKLTHPDVGFRCAKDSP